MNTLIILAIYFLIGAILGWPERKFSVPGVPLYFVMMVTLWPFLIISFLIFKYLTK